MGEFICNLACIVLLAGIYLWCTRKRSRSERIVGVVIFLVAGSFLDRLCILVMEGIMQESALRQVRLLGLGISRSMEGIFLVLSFFMPGKADGSSETDSGMDYMEKLAVAGAVFFWCVQVVTGAFLGRRMWDVQNISLVQADTLTVDFMWTLFLFLVFLGFYLSVYLHGRADRARREEQDRQEERRQAETYLGTIENHYQRTRELWHDLRNHISLLQLLLKEEEYGQMRDYLRVFSEEIDRSALPAKSGNLIVDAVLADKLARAKQKNIEVYTEFCDLSGLPLKSDEVCSLFGNLLDNAIEECLRVSGERKINIVCRARGEDIYFSVKNTLLEGELTKEEASASRKKDRENVVGHGIGLRSVERVVNRYAGELVTDAGEGMFTAAVWIPGSGGQAE